MIVNEITETLKFLRKEGYEIYLSLSEEFSKDSRKALSEFRSDNDDGNAAEIPVFYDDREIARLKIAGDKEKLSALSVPLKYMIGKLYEESRKTVTENNEHDIYVKALQYIKKHYTENITIADVAEHTGYSGSYFGYAFKKKYKMSVAQYVRELQLAKSKDLLENTTFSVSVVAGYVGFDDSNYFSALFKKYFGLSPKEYRKLHSTLV